MVKDEIIELTETKKRTFRGFTTLQEIIDFLDMNNAMKGKDATAKVTRTCQSPAWKIVFNQKLKGGKYVPANGKKSVALRSAWDDDNIEKPIFPLMTKKLHLDATRFVGEETEQTTSHVRESN